MARHVDIENCGALVEVLANMLEMCHFKHKAGCLAPDCRDCLHRHFNEFNSSHLIPTADVAPVKHGHWVAKEFSERGYSKHYTYTNYFCSECGRRLKGYSSPSDAPYCHCGAKMDGEDGESNGQKDP